MTGNEPGTPRKVLGMKPQVFVPVISLVAIAAVVILIRQSFVGDAGQRQPQAAADRQAATDKIPALSRTAGANPNSARAHYELGKALADAGRYAEAAQSLKRATEIEGTFDRAFAELASTYDRLGLFEDSIRAYDHVLRMNPDDAQANYEMGQVQLKAGHKEEAVEYIGRAVALDSTYAGSVPAEVRSEVEAATEGEPSQEPEARQPEGGAPASEPEPAPAQEGEEEEEEAAAGGEAADLDEAITPSQKAMDDFDDSIVMKSDSVDININLGMMFNSAGQYGKAAGAFSKAIGVEPLSAPAHFGLGIAHLGLGDRDAAIAEYNALTSLDPVLAGKLLVKINE